MARPSMWANAYQTIPTLRSQVWVDGHMMDFYLMSIWYAARGQTHIRFADITSAIISYEDGIPQLPSHAEIELFQQRYFIDPQSPDSSRPIGFIAFHRQHYFTVVFHYDAAIAYVLGMRISEDCQVFVETLDDWETWAGPLYWTRIAALHGLNPGDPQEVTVVTHNWPQNGMDCGPIACFLLKHFMDSGLGLDTGSIYLPPIPCGHELRWRMLGAIREACRTSWQDYNLLTASNLPQVDIWNSWNDTIFVEDEDLAAMENEASGQQYSPVVRDLNIASTNCPTCQRAPWEDRPGADDPPTIPDDDGPPREADEDEDEDGQQTSSKAQCLRRLFRRHPDTRRARCRDLLPPRTIKGRLSDEPNQDGNHRKHVKEWSQGTMYRFPRPTLPVDLPAYKGRRWLPFDRKFDEYEGGPVYESMKPYRNPYEFVMEPYYRQGIWTMFRDYGWRLQPSFHQMFYLEDPIHVLDHVLVVGVTGDYDPSQQISEHVTGAYSLGRALNVHSDHQDHVTISDVSVYGAAEMLALGRIDSEDSFDAFVRGRAGQNHICIDLERDHVPLDPTDIKAMSIFLGPIIDKAAPIKKHNHVYVEVVVPQSEEDASALGGRTEWWSLPLPLSAIPHTSFGTIGCGSGSLNVYIFFPRMIHHDELSGRRATNIPKEVLDYFWMHVLLPAIADNVDDTEALYAALTLPEDIVETMKNIIQEEPEKLTLFGSFFFVVEAKGIKLWTKSSADEKKPIQSLISEFPALDWNYMTNRRHGELMIDLGITFHPVWKEPLVGLWRLEQLEASFGASGFVLQ
ncbi:hypothetical protein BU15DRAFT_83272 [Melanogaster broomeanus]|nr:hypothetical protein BU15DRAFT_83272 [Melanogaster broomeanus]